MTVYTIGHSNGTLEDFVRLLLFNRIEIVVDVRSVPYSRYVKQFNKDNLRRKLEAIGIGYLYMGDLLGGMPMDKSLYINGKIDFNLLRHSQTFAEGIERLIDTIKKYTVAIMCAEEDPLRCHRRHLVAKELHDQGIEVIHIRVGGYLFRDDFRDEEQRQRTLFGS